MTVPTRFWKIAANAVLVVFSLIISAVLLEIALRVYAGLAFPKMMVLDDGLGWRHAANVSKTFENEFGEAVLVVQDADGHRGTGHAPEKPAGKFRILALGDSFTEGVQVGEEDLFTARLERADARLEVINAGVGGYGTVQEYLYLKSAGLRFRPDLVLLMFFENDLTDNALTYYPGFGPRPYATLTAGSVQIVETLDASEYEKFILPVPFRMTLNKHSYLYYFANSRLYQAMFATKLRQLQKADLHAIDPDSVYALFSGVLQALKGLLDEQGIGLVVVLIPTREDVASGSSRVAGLIERQCQMAKVSCLSLMDRFGREAGGGAQLYFPEDIHWTTDGHKVAADEILSYLRRGWAEASAPH